MSKIKTTLPEDFDATDAQEPMATSEPVATNEFSASDHYYLELINAVLKLQVLKPYDYINELKYSVYLLNKLVEEMEHPF